MAQRGIDNEEAEQAPDKDGRVRCRVRGRRRRSAAQGTRKRLGYKSRLGLGMLLVAVIVDLVGFELSVRWSSEVNPDSADTEVISRGDS
jgi:hypothetical protein